jgi:hypothetical protein
MANLELDYIEYSTDALAQEAYVTDGVLYLNSGGTITVNGTKKVHKFLLADSGTNFVVGKDGNVQVLVVAGGVGHGAWHHSGGGGAGEMVEHASKAVTVGNVAVVVGAGGATCPSANFNDPRYVGSTGGNSSFGDIVANGGGGGCSYTNSTLIDASGDPGGSGGGAAASGGTGGASSKSGTGGGTGYGNAGANKNNTTPGGGGGGAGGAGGVPTAGAGRANTITGASVTYATGGIGNPATVNRGDAAANTGNGGTTGAVLEGGKGGSGIVIVSYITADFSTLYLQCYSEATIKTQGSYSLKAIATQTDSLNKTLIKTLSPVSNLTGVKNIKFDIRASRTGSNIKIGIHDAGGTTTEITPNITTADTFQTIDWDLSAVSDANKDAIDTITITIVNADAANTFYLDNIVIAQAIDVFGWVN